MKKYIISGLLLFAMCIPFAPFAYADDDVPGDGTLNCIPITVKLGRAAGPNRTPSRDSNSNGEVSILQDFLQSKGYLNSEPTGYFGLLTFQAVKNFQAANGLTPDGSVGPITRAKINALMCGGSNITPVTPGCPIGAVYSSITGQRCDGTGTTFPPGCTSTSGFSTTTGLRCDGTTTTTFPPGCNSTSGYSSTTGARCDGVNTDRYSVSLSANGILGRNTDGSDRLIPVKLGESVTFSWQSNASSCELSNNTTSFSKIVGSSGSQVINNLPLGKHNFIITCPHPLTSNYAKDEALVEVTSVITPGTTGAPSAATLTWVPKQSNGNTINLMKVGYILAPGIPYIQVCRGSIEAGVRPVCKSALNTSNGTTPGNWDDFSMYSDLKIADLLSTRPNGVTVEYTIYSKLGDGTVSLSSTSQKALIKPGAATTQPSITVISPNGGESYVYGGQYTIKWSTQGINSTDIAIGITNTATNRSDNIILNAANSGSYSWVPLFQPGSYIINVVTIDRTTDKTYSDSSNAPFTITPLVTQSSITVTSPNGGETWTRGTTKPITWQYTGTSFSPKEIRITPNGQSYYYAIAEINQDVSSYNWAVGTREGGVALPDGLYKITVCDAQERCDSSNGTFTIGSSTVAQTFSVSGRILQSNGIPATAVVSVGGKSVGTVAGISTAVDGRYSITGIPVNATGVVVDGNTITAKVDVELTGTGVKKTWYVGVSAGNNTEFGDFTMPAPVSTSTFGISNLTVQRFVNGDFVPALTNEFSKSDTIKLNWSVSGTVPYEYTQLSGRYKFAVAIRPAVSSSYTPTPILLATTPTLTSGALGSVTLQTGLSQAYVGSGQTLVVCMIDKDNTDPSCDYAIQNPGTPKATVENVKVVSGSVLGASISLPAGCFSGALYSVTTGKSCM